MNNIGELMNSAFVGDKELCSRGGCYRPRWITPSEICMFLDILLSLIHLLLIMRVVLTNQKRGNILNE